MKSTSNNRTGKTVDPVAANAGDPEASADAMKAKFGALEPETKDNEAKPATNGRGDAANANPLVAAWQRPTQS